jgi:hypothetical protein
MTTIDVAGNSLASAAPDIRHGGDAVTVRTGESRGDAFIEVADTGAVIPEFERLFSISGGTPPRRRPGRSGWA